MSCWMTYCFKAVLIVLDVLLSSVLFLHINCPLPPFFPPFLPLLSLPPSLSLPIVTFSSPKASPGILDAFVAAESLRRELVSDWD